MGSENRHFRRWAAASVFVLSAPLLFVPMAGAYPDSDGDGIPNCEENAGLLISETRGRWHTDSADADSDDDGILDAEEVLRTTSQTKVGRLAEAFGSCAERTYSALSDPNQPDSDEDGLDDARELSEGSAAFAKDSDADGLSDAGERDWGSDPHNDDTDGDGVRDGDDVDDGSTPVIFDEPEDDKAWSREFAEGVTLGDAKGIDSVPQLLGAIAGGSSSTIPVIGFVTGTLADGRDALANVVRGDFAAAGASALGVLPFAGDTVRSSKLLTQFVENYPAELPALGKAISAWSLMPVSARTKLLQVADAGAVGKLQKLKVSDGAIIQMVKRGTQLVKVSNLLNKVGSRTVQGIPTAFTDDAGFVRSAEDAENALRAYAEKVDKTEDVESGPIYIGGLAGPARDGGRLIDSCTECVSGPDEDKSTLRLAKLGSQVYSDTIQNQIDKDRDLRQQGYQLEWHFFAGPTGLSIESVLLDALDDADIPYFIHLPS